MKKAKFMLAAIAVIAVVSGTLAFRASRGHMFSYLTCNTAASPKTCALAPNNAIDYTTTASSTAAVTTIPSATTDLNQEGKAWSVGCSNPLYLKRLQ